MVRTLVGIGGNGPPEDRGGQGEEGTRHTVPHRTAGLGSRGRQRLGDDPAADQVHAVLLLAQLVRRRQTSALDVGRAARGGRPVASRPLLSEALPLLPLAAECDRPLLAIDFGCRDGFDSLDLLKLGWTVLVVTETVRVKKQLLARLPHKHSARLTIEVGEFCALALPSADLISTGTSLPLRPREGFGPVWSRIVPAIRPGGWFIGQFLGDRDCRADAGLTFLTRKQVVTLLNGFRIELLRERDAAEQHVFDVIARRRPLTSAARRST